GPMPIDTSRPPPRTGAGGVVCLARIPTSFPRAGDHTMLGSAPQPDFEHNRPRLGLGDVVRDLKLAWRALLRTPGFLIAAVVTLALAMGATTGMFNVVNTVMLEPLPFEDPDRLVVLSGTAPGSD